MSNEAALLGNPLGTELGEAYRVCLSDVWVWGGMARRALCSLTLVHLLVCTLPSQSVCVPHYFLLWPQTACFMVGQHRTCNVPEKLPPVSPGLPELRAQPCTLASAGRWGVFGHSATLVTQARCLLP